MVHNGIEQGMMSVIAEVWALLTDGFRLDHDQTAAVLAGWNASEDGPLRDAFLVDIGAAIEHARAPPADDRGVEGRVIDRVRDEVTQDVTGEESTGVWTYEEAVTLHVPAPSLLAAHLLRCASSDLARRAQNREAAGEGGRSADSLDPQRLSLEGREGEGEEEEEARRRRLIDYLHGTTYFCFLACFAQGLDIIWRKDRAEGWGLNYADDVLQTWRGGCTIQADGVVDVLEEAFREGGGLYMGGDTTPTPDPAPVLSSPAVGRELARQLPSAREAVLRAVEADLHIPALAQTLEHYKYETSTRLPTRFTEAQLDFFGHHMLRGARRSDR